MLDFQYQVVRRPKRKTASITIKPDNSVTVMVPKSLSEKQIVQLLVRKQQWIKKTFYFNLHKRASFTPKEYVSGESFLYLGKKYRLSVINDGQNAVKLIKGLFTVHVGEGLSEKETQHFIFQQLSHWYQQHALDYLQKEIKKLSKIIDASPVRIGVKYLKSRWGSCTSKGVVNFNWKIIMAPPPIVEYVVAHELCHLKHLNHSKAYWNLVAGVIPDYRERKEWLRVHGLQLEI